MFQKKGKIFKAYKIFWLASVVVIFFGRFWHRHADSGQEFQSLVIPGAFEPFHSASRRMSAMGFKETLPFDIHLYLLNDLFQLNILKTAYFWENLFAQVYKI